MKKLLALVLTLLSLSAAHAIGDIPELLEPDKAFLLDRIEARDGKTIVASWIIAPGYYLYRDKFKFEIADRAVTLKAPVFPAGKKKDDPGFGIVEVYYDKVSIVLPVERRSDGAQTVKLRVTIQGCNEPVGVCLPPMMKEISVALPAASAAAAGAPPAGNVSDSAPAAHDPQIRKILLAMLTAFGTGLLLTFTPCVLPMIPILSSVLVSSTDRHVTKLEGGLLSATYVLGTAVTYTAAGVLAGHTGGQLQAYFQNPWAIGIFSGLFVLLALSMFGFYELQVPSSIQTLLHRHSSDLHLRTRHTKTGAFFGVFGMGLVSSLVIGACVSPLLISALGVAIAERDPVLGGAIMFAMALGMGTILIAIGVGAGFLLPKAGPWMDTVKHAFGVLILAVAIYVLGALPDVPVLFLWAALLVVTAVYLGATQSLPHDADGWRYLWKGVGTLLLVWGVLALVGGFYGERSILKPLPAGFISGPAVSAAESGAAAHFRRLTSLTDIERALAEARAQGKPVLLDFYATWCTDCVRMEKTTFADARVVNALGRAVLLQADVTDNNDASAAIKRRFGVYGPPAFLFFGADGAQRKDLDFYGYRNVEEFLALF
ncbi:MAG: protein-disulfide reductase DsbD, partial [Gammaproteobacteria bacterium]|nr:protein-disulfide reductase DsbD [Gammaproteobacteria bacterium]